MELVYKKPGTKDYSEAVDILNESEELYKQFPISKKMGDDWNEPWTTKELEENKQQREFRGLYLHEEMIGFATFKNKEGLIWINEFHIKNDLRRQGLGTKFMDFITNELKDSTEYLALEAWPDAAWAMDFYDKYGFKEDPSVYRGKGTYTKVLVKKIS